MIQTAIKIGEVQTIRSDDWKVSPDDRQEQIKTIGGVIVQDFGHIEQGDKFTCNVKIRPDDYDTLMNYWHNRIRVNVIDENGNLFPNMRVVVKEYEPIKFFKNFYKFNLEFWRV